MWIMLNNAFLSVVQPRYQDMPQTERRRAKAAVGSEYGTDLLMVRARKPEHLQAVFVGRRIYRWKARDYPCRVFVEREQFAAILAANVAGLHYTNFKDSVEDDEYHDALMQVWSVMNRYGHGAFRRAQPRLWGPPYQPIYDMDDAGQPVADDEADAEWFANAQVKIPEEGCCGLLGCTPDHPCRDCLRDAILTADADEAYGDFDDRDDADAQSHLRVPPR